MKRILVVDDHSIVREGITQLLAGQPDLSVCGDAVDIAGARQAVRELVPDVALIDLSLGRENGLDLIPLCLGELPSLAILTLSMHDEALYAKRALQAGARGYIMKHEGTESLLQAIRTVLAGEVYVSAKINASFLRTLSHVSHGSHGSRASLALIERREGPFAELSNRELEIFRLVGHGLTTKEIAAQLFVSVKTVEAHRAKIKQKLQLGSSAALVAHAAEWRARSARVDDPPQSS